MKAPSLLPRLLLPLLAALALPGATPGGPALPAEEALLPGRRIVAFYGNPLSRRMGVLGELPPEVMLDRLAAQAEAYARADTTVPVVPALQLVAVVAQSRPGRDGRYRARMDAACIEEVAGWARRRGYLLILDVQVGRSTVAAELEPLLPYLKRPEVHLALDPEFAMRADQVPGEVIGHLDASDVNAAVDALAALVSEHRLPPKLLIVHRFTTGMLTRPDRIRPDPRVQVVVDMDGFGTPALKRNSYAACVRAEPVGFAGIKLFYRQDTRLMSPAEVLRLRPVPNVVIYQ